MCNFKMFRYTTLMLLILISVDDSLSLNRNLKPFSETRRDVSVHTEKGIALHTQNECSQYNDTELIYRNAKQLWGKEMENFTSSNLCEMASVLAKAQLQKIKFTNKGLLICQKACKAQQKYMLRVPPTEVILKDSYCSRKRANATCVCLFKMECKVYQHYAFVRFITNRFGDIAMIYSEAGHPYN